MPHAALIAGCVIAGLATAYAVHTTILKPIHEEGWDQFCANGGPDPRKTWDDFASAWGKRAHDVKEGMQRRRRGSEADESALREIEEFERERRSQGGRCEENENVDGRGEEGASTAIGNEDVDERSHLRHRQTNRNGSAAATPLTLRNPFDDLDSPHHGLGFDEEQRSDTLSPPSNQGQILFDSGSNIDSHSARASRPTSPGARSDTLSATSWSDVGAGSGSGGARSATSEEWDQLSEEESDEEDDARR